MLIKADQSCLIVIDVQERLVPAMQAPARVIRNTRTLMTKNLRSGPPAIRQTGLNEGFSSSLLGISFAIVQITLDFEKAAPIDEQLSTPASPP